MKKTLITIAFAAASVFAAQTASANPPAAGATETKPAPVKTRKAKKAHTKKMKKAATGTAAPASK